MVAQQELSPELRSKGGASDLVQETFLEAQRDFGRFRGDSEGELLAWLRRLLLNNLANFSRSFRATDKRRLAREVVLEPGSSSGENPGGLAASLSTPSGEAVAREEVEALQTALARLSADYRQIIVLRYQEQHSFEKISQLMNRSESAVRKLWARAVHRLRRELELPHEP